MEQLPLAEGNHDQQRQPDDADGSGEPDAGLCDGLRHVDAGGIDLYTSYGDRVLLSAKCVCRGYYRSGEIRKI